jgi:hypothetical protein
MFVLFSHANNPKSKGGAKRRLYFLDFIDNGGSRKH